MPDETTNGQDAQTNQQSTDAAGKTPASGDQWRMEDLPASTQAYIRELRDEAKKTRLEKDAADKARKSAEQSQLEEQGNWRKLAEDRATELAKLTPYQERATDLEKVITEGNAERIALIPEQMRSLVPANYTAADLHRWLNANQSLLTRKPAPETDAGAGTGSGGGAGTLTDDEKRMAALIGITHEAFAKAKK